MIGVRCAFAMADGITMDKKYSHHGTVAILRMHGPSFTFFAGFQVLQGSKLGFKEDSAEGRQFRHNLRMQPLTVPPVMRNSHWFIPDL